MKILVAGPFQAGKSKLIAALDNQALNIMTLDKNNKECTIGMDIGTFECEGIKISLFGTPGLLRFKTMRQIVTEGSDGVIFLFDGKNPDMDDSALQILNEVKSILPKNTPFVYAVNKIDDPDCRSVEVVREQNYLPKNAKMFGIDAETGKDITKPLDELILMVRENLKPLVKTLKDYENNPLGLKVALDRNVDSVMELLNAMELRGIILIDRTNMTYKMRESAKFFS